MHAGAGHAAGAGCTDIDRGGDAMADGATLESQIGELLDQETFEPPKEFAEQRGRHRRVDRTSRPTRTPRASGPSRPRQLHWHEKWDQVLDWSDPPNAKWFVGGKLNVAYNCVDRHVEAGNGDRVAFHWRGEEGEELDVTYADLHRDVQKFANALKDNGIGKGDVVGIFLPMIPEVAVAMLACARIGAIHNVVFGGFSAESVKERMEFSEAKALVTVDGARRKGKTAPIKEQVDEVMGDVESIETIFVVKRTDNDAPMTEGRDVWYHEALRGGRRRVRGRAARRRAPALHPLLVGLDGQAEGHPAHDRRLPDRRRLHAPRRVRPQARGGRLLVLGRRRLGHRALLHRLRAAGQRLHVGDVRGRAGLPGQGRLVVAGGPLRRDDLLHRADRDPRVHQVGRRVPGEARPLLAAAARHGRRADQPEGLALVPQGHRRRALPDRRHVVADRDRPHHDHARCRALQPTKPGSAGKPLPGIEAQVVNEDDGEDAGTEQGLLTLRQPWPGMLRTLYKDEDRFVETYWDKFGRDVYFVGDAARKDEDGYFWIIGRVDDVINVSGHRLSTAEVESAIVSHEKVAEAAVIGQQDEDTGQSITAFVTLSGDQEGDDDMVAGAARARRQADRQARAARSASSGPTTCPRRARARSCAGCCATSPRAASSATSRRCATRT